MFRKFLLTEDPVDLRNYNRFKRKLSKRKKRKKRAYFRELIKEANSKKDFKKTWQAINKVLNNGKKKLISPSDVMYGPDGKDRTQCQKMIANLLNKHFTTIGEKLAEKLKNNTTKHETFMGPKLEKTFFLREISLDEVIDEINGIFEKKGMGFDNIPPKVIKWAPHLFAPILVELFNKCIKLGYYPENMKVARVVPIHKGGDRNDINNYRPISILTQFNRLFERILANRLMSFFEKNKVITSKQFGFLRNHSTEHAILDLKEYIMNGLGMKKITGVIFLDLKKTSDTVSHDILLKPESL